MAELSGDEILKKIDLGFPAVARLAVAKAHQTQTKLVIWRGGKIVEIEPENFGEEPEDRKP